MNERQQQRKMANKTFLTIAKYHARCRRRRRPVSSETLLKNCRQFLTTFFPSIVWPVCVRLTWLYDNMTETTCSEREKEFFFLFLHRGVSMFVFVCHCWRLQRERNSSKRFLSFPFKKKKIVSPPKFFSFLYRTHSAELSAIFIPTSYILKLGRNLLRFYQRKPVTGRYKKLPWLEMGQKICFLLIPIES